MADRDIAHRIAAVPVCPRRRHSEKALRTRPVLCLIAI